MLAPAVYMVLLVVQAVVAPLPAPAVAMAGGYTFGTLEGFLLTWSGALLGGVLSFGISRLFGRGLVASNARMERLDRYVATHGAILVFVLRLIPLVSFDAISYAPGLAACRSGGSSSPRRLGWRPARSMLVYLGGATPGVGVWAALIGLAVLSVAVYAYLRLRYRSRALR